MWWLVVNNLLENQAALSFLGGGHTFPIFGPLFQTKITRLTRHAARFLPFFFGQASTTSWSSSIRVAFRWGWGHAEDLQRPYLFPPSQNQFNGSLRGPSGLSHDSEPRRIPDVLQWKKNDYLEQERWFPCVSVHCFPKNRIQLPTICNKLPSEVIRSESLRMFLIFSCKLSSKSAIIKHGGDFPANTTIVKAMMASQPTY